MANSKIFTIIIAQGKLRKNDRYDLAYSRINQNGNKENLLTTPELFLEWRLRMTFSLCSIALKPGKDTTEN